MKTKPRTQLPLPASCDSPCPPCLRGESPLFVREEPQTRDLVCRTVAVRAATINEEDRSVEAVLATETPALVYDWGRDQVIEEVLRMDGAEIPDRMPMLENHYRWTLDAVMGSIRNVRKEGENLIGRLFFAKDDLSQRAWEKVRDGHITDVSVGYRVLESTDIPAGQTKNIGGRNYTAGARTLRVSTRWRPHETSLVPIGADPKAKIREAAPPASHQPTPSLRRSLDVNEQLRAYLESIGLRKEASDAEAWAFYRGLANDQAEHARGLLADGEEVPPDPQPASGNGEGARANPANPPANPPAGQSGNPPAAPDAVQAERSRVARIHELARGEMPADLVQRAIAEGWAPDRASEAFLGHYRSRMGTGNGNQGPAIHSRSHELDCTRNSLAAAFMLRHGLDPVTHHAEFRGGRFVPRREGQRSAEWEQAADRGYQYREFSLVDFCREACRLEGRNYSSRDEMIRMALSGSALTAIFTTSFQAQFMQGYQDAEDTTVGWTSETEVGTFQPTEAATMGRFGRMQRHTRGGEAKHMDTDDSAETFRVYRFSGQFVLDEQDIIDDRFGQLDQVAPDEMGASARATRPDMVYAHLLSNPELGADETALFHADHANLWEHADAALSAAALQTAITSFGKQRVKDRPINMRPRFLLVPQDIKFTAQILLQSAERIIASASGGTYNPLKDQGMTLVADDRIGAAGVVDPLTAKQYTGSAVNWYLAARPGENAARTILVAYLRGTGRAPIIRSFQLTQGRWGIGWDAKLDIGTKALDYRGLYRSKGAA
jgi:hypothetical protein